MRPKMQWLADLIYWGVVASAVFVTTETAWRLYHEPGWTGVDFGTIVLNEPIAPGRQLSGRVQFVNLTGATVSLLRADGATHVWFEWRGAVPDRILPDVSGELLPCGTEDSRGEVDIPPGASWWCFRQERPLPGDAEIETIRKGNSAPLWFAGLLAFRDGSGRLHHAGICRRYNPSSERFERGSRFSCDWFVAS